MTESALMVVIVSVFAVAAAICVFLILAEKFPGVVKGFRRRTDRPYRPARRCWRAGRPGAAELFRSLQARAPRQQRDSASGTDAGPRDSGSPP